MINNIELETHKDWEKKMLKFKNLYLMNKFTIDLSEKRV